MSTNSAIEWTETTWNPVVGCDKVSAGCKNCYAERMALRLQAMGMKKYQNGFEVNLCPDLLTLPYQWKKPRTVFVNSMSDLFHAKVPFWFISEVFDTMKNTPKHNYQILTKRAERLLELADRLTWEKNIWMGVTVENAKVLSRIGHLQKVPAAIRFLSLEPLLEPLPNMPLDGIDWVIVGGESGPRARPMAPEWVSDIRDQCIQHRVPFFFKQWGGTQRKANGRLLGGRTWDEMPSLSTMS
jgi:protein gp37